VPSPRVSPEKVLKESASQADVDSLSDVDKDTLEALLEGADNKEALEAWSRQIESLSPALPFHASRAHRSGLSGVYLDASRRMYMREAGRLNPGRIEPHRIEPLPEPLPAPAGEVIL